MRKIGGWADDRSPRRRGVAHARVRLECPRRSTSCRVVCRSVHPPRESRTQRTGSTGSTRSTRMLAARKRQAPAHYTTVVTLGCQDATRAQRVPAFSSAGVRQRLLGTTAHTQGGGGGRMGSAVELGPVGCAVWDYVMASEGASEPGTRAEREKSPQLGTEPCCRRPCRCTPFLCIGGWRIQCVNGTTNPKRHGPRPTAHSPQPRAPTRARFNTVVELVGQSLRDASVPDPRNAGTRPRRCLVDRVSPVSVAMAAG